MTLKNNSIYRLIILCSIASIASCVTVPKTANEFRAAVIKGSAFTTKETHKINRPFSAVIKNVRRKSKKCLGFGYTMRTTIGASSRQSTVTYHPTFKILGKGKAQMFMREKRSPRPTRQPKGGTYIFVADINRISRSKTRITMYGPSISRWKPIFNAVKAWGKGKNIQCPDSP